VRQDPRVLEAYLGVTDFKGRPRGAAWSGEKAAILTASKLTAGFGAAPALEDADLDVFSGEMVAVLGANGAGKSTMMRAISGLHRPVKGEVFLNDEPIGQAQAHEIALAGLALVPEGRQIFPELTVMDNLLLGAYRRRDDMVQNDIARLLDRFPRLRERVRSKGGVLSGGEQQMLAIARGLMALPDILVLDEPSLGLAPSMINELFDILAELRDDGVTILIVDQMANLALAVADRGYVLESGRIVHSGPARELRSDKSIEQAYLGSL
jgi:branched-chain amino acid transport system permease protein